MRNSIPVRFLALAALLAVLSSRAEAESGTAVISDIGSVNLDEFVQEAQSPVPDWLGPLDFPQVPVPREQDVFRDPATPVLGNPDGDVNVVEFFDYHCSYCKKVAADLRELIRTDPGIRLVMKEYPILGEDSVTGAKAALAAAKQGRYREMHETLMAYRGQFTPAALESLAADAQVDPQRMFNDMQGPDIQEQISKTLLQGRGLGFSGTPGFIFGRIPVPGAISLDDMRKLVAEARRKACASAPCLGSASQLAGDVLPVVSPDDHKQ
ncbi:DsbA family protein [Dongia sp.]|uniref:DsbA family protein n=1 Tax=Dongia sp. TaxID=1977262 RepID=UPI003750F515